MAPAEPKPSDATSSPGEFTALSSFVFVVASLHAPVSVVVFMCHVAVRRIVAPNLVAPAFIYGSLDCFCSD